MNIRTLIESLNLGLQKRLVTPRLIYGMRKCGSPVLRSVGAALEVHHTGQLTDDEQRWIAAIEKLREGVNSSTETVTGPDYGAGSLDDAIPYEKPYEGETTTEVVGEACRHYSSPRVWATLLFCLMRKLQPTACIELGTCLGVSTAYQASALELNGGGSLVTLEGSAGFAEIARRNLESLGLSHCASVVVGRFQDTLDGVLDGFGKVDYAFIDGHHDEQATLQYFEQFLPYLSERALLVFDDIAWSSGMRRAWRRIRDDFRVDVSFDFSKIGVCLVGVGVKARYNMMIA